ncbi:ATP-binding cassette domain-containing protein [Candidatus Fermentibacteria bacterium]|nr:ATP-binding cassette domain-containing protein [Candidatus Fermentibacteria bacterium]
MMLEVDGISFGYDGPAVLENTSFGVRTHELAAVMGPNGVGKTTLLRCINRILRPWSGEVRIQGRKLSGYSGREVARRVAYVAQRSEPGRVTAFDAVLLGRKPHMSWRVSRHDIELTEATLRLLGLEELSLRHTDEMSGGEYQKVCIARAIVQEPSVMLLDEPTASLDLRNQLEILRLLRGIVKVHDMCAVMTMHDLNTAFRYADSFIFLKEGRVHAAVGRTGITADVVEEVYGVPVAVQWHQDHPVVLPLDGDRDELPFGPG